MDKYIATDEQLPTTTKDKRIIVVGKPSEEIMANVVTLAKAHDIEIIVREVGEDGKSFAYAEGFNPNPPAVTLPYSLNPYLSISKELSELPILSDYLPNPTSKQSKYARVATQAELDTIKQGRNELCHCGSNLKFKKCHGK